MIINEIKDIIEMSWTKETCISGLKEEWNSNNPGIGQCDITTLIINDFMGGKIMRCTAYNGSHYYNLINGEIIDLTVEQFNGNIPDYREGEERTREYLLSNEDTKNRYLLLLNNVKDNFIKYGKKDFYLIDEDDKKYSSKIPGTIGGNSKLKIYGKLDCSNAISWINKGYYVDNRVFFDSEETAIKAGYRPCGKCMKIKYKEWKNNK